MNLQSYGRNAPHLTHLYDTSPDRLGAAAIAIAAVILSWGAVFVLLWCFA